MAFVLPLPPPLPPSPPPPPSPPSPPPPPRPPTRAGDVALGGVLTTAGVVGGGLVVALVVTTLRAARATTPVATAGSEASTVAGRARDALSAIPRTRLLPFDLHRPRVVFVPVAPTRAEITAPPRPPGAPT